VKALPAPAQRLTPSQDVSMAFLGAVQSYLVALPRTALASGGATAGPRPHLESAWHAAGYGGNDGLEGPPFAARERSHLARVVALASRRSARATSRAGGRSPQRPALRPCSR